VNEGRTTAIFAAVAAVTLSLAYWTKPSAITTEYEESIKQTNQVLFKDFKDPDQAASLQIVKYDESLGQLDPFEIAKDKSGLWKIPSHDDYPADAAEQVRDATTPLIDLKALAGVTTDRGDHGYYGVLNPDDEKLKVGESGVGMLVRVKDASDKVLADLIIGKADKGEDQRFVRVPSQDAVYLVKLSTTPFTTEFRKWIKGELLGVKSFDITSIGLRDYAILPTQNGYGMSKNFDADLTFDPSKSQWNLDKMLSYEGGQAKAVEVGPNQELKAASLNDLRTAVQSLEIVNVRRKPTGLAADLKADKSLMDNKESLKSLYSQGFFPQEGPNGPEIYATGGETLVGTQDGVQYLLRFGEAVAKLSGNDEDADAGEEAVTGGLRRYLLVTARLDDSKFPLPDLQPLPETIEDLLKLESEENGTGVPAENASESPDPSGTGKAEIEQAANDGDAGADQPPAPEPKGDSVPAEDAAAPEVKETESKAEAPKVEDAPDANPGVTEEKSGDQCGPQEQEQADNAPEQSPKAEVADAPAAQEPNADAPQAGDDKPAESADAEPADAKPAEEKPAENAKPAESEEELKERLEAVRERIAKENQRKIDQRNEKIAAARKKVLELNARFSDWYYIVSDTAYRKLKVSRDQLIVEKGASDNAAADVNPGSVFPGFPGSN
jgi:hypothetical protein